jgi:hypothetical protein
MLVSLAIHFLVAMLLVIVLQTADIQIDTMRRTPAQLVAPRIRFRVITPEDTGGGGGDDALLRASHGQLVRPAPKQFVPLLRRDKESKIPGHSHRCG